jgi:hypothetical protein
MVAAFRQGLKETGYVESQNVAVEYRWADGETRRLPAMAEELVRALPIASTPSPGSTCRNRARVAHSGVQKKSRASGGSRRSAMTAVRPAGTGRPESVIK